jgi:hypothetical protein
MDFITFFYDLRLLYILYNTRTDRPLPFDIVRDLVVAPFPAPSPYSI